MQHLVYEILPFSYIFIDSYVTCKVTAGGKTQNLTATAKIIKPSVKLEIKNKISELDYGKTYTLNTALTPMTSNDVVTWTSSDSKVATVDANGKVKAVKEGKVTITATTMSGKTDSVVLNVYGGPDATPTPKPTAKPTQKPTQKPVASTAVYEQNFEKDTGEWIARGGELVIKSGDASPAGGNYVLNTGRTSSWNGPAMDMTGILKAGKEYKISVYVKQTSGDGEVIKFTWDKNGGSQYIGISNAATKKGEWTLLEGTISVDKDTTSIVVYFEAENATLDFMIDGIKVVDPNASTTSTPQTGKIELVPMQPEGVTVNGNKATIEPQYLSAIYPLPNNIDGSKVESIKVVFSSDQQIGVKIKGANDADVIPNDYPNYGITGMTEATVIYDISGSNVPVTQIEFMSLANKVNIEVKSVEFTLKGGAKEEPKEEVAGTAIDLSTVTPISGDAPTVSGGKLTFTTNNNKCAFMLPVAVASGDKVTVAADFNFVALEPASVVRFYLINDNVDSALSNVAVISNADVSATDVKKTVTLTANGDANMLLMTNFNWDGSTPQAVTVNGISVK